MHGLTEPVDSCKTMSTDVRQSTSMHTYIQYCDPRTDKAIELSQKQLPADAKRIANPFHPQSNEPEANVSKMYQSKT